MHKLERSTTPAPVCLQEWDYTQKTWDDFTRDGQDCKRQLRTALLNLQGIPGITTADGSAEYGLRCAYCEGPIRHEGHIEHFRRKNSNHFPQLTFIWENLFLACGSNGHCGHYKDRGGAPYDPNDLIKPDEHDPDDFLYFHSQGNISVRSTRTGMTDDDRRRALETIRVFNLDCGPLQGARRQAIQIYNDRNPGILEFFMTCDDIDFREEYMRAEIEATRWDPHSTVIKHFFEKAA